MEYIYIGKKFPTESRGAMCSIYTNKGTRCSWSDFEALLEAGSTVTIRPANKPELETYQAQLDIFKKYFG